MTSVTVVTPWRDARELIDGYVNAINIVRPDRVLICDTGSSPPLRADEFHHSVWVEVAAGFVESCNLGLDETDTDAVVFLNNDIRATGDWLAPILRQLRPGVLVGAQLRTDPHGDVDGRPFAYLDGWCLAGMREDLLELGGMDDRLVEPAYYSDNLLCLKAKRAGMKLVAVDTPLEHIGNYTSRRDPEARSRASEHNRAIYIEEARKAMVAA